jgi:Icc-related predicted phosphoesterase
MASVRIAAVADVHSPRFLNEFMAAISRCETPDIFLFAGDMINRGKSSEYPKVLDAVESLGSEFPIVACFGNEEPIACRDELRQITQDRVVFLDESHATFSISGKKVAIIGMSAGAKEPASTQMTVNDDIRMAFEARAERLSQLLQKSHKQAKHVILLMHFSPLLEDNSLEYSWWVSKALKKSSPTFIIHGHVHDRFKEKIEIGTTVIRNVALPACGSVTELTL